MIEQAVATTDQAFPDEDALIDVEALCEAFGTALRGLGLGDEMPEPVRAETCRYAIAIDDYDGHERLLGEWLDEDGVRHAHFVRYGDGRMFAEHDVLRPHPGRKDMCIEAIEVWGQAGKLKSEARLLPSL